MPVLASCFKIAKMMKICILAFLSLFFNGPLSQPDVNYSHKSLFKEIEKVWGIDDPALKEIKIPDSIQRKNSILGKFFRIDANQNVSQYNYIFIGRVNSCRAGGCSISNDLGHDSNSEYFDYFILFDESKTVQLVKVFNYQATHGQEVSAKGWLKQFVGFDGKKPLTVGKNIDAISGATISVYGITLDVEDKTALLKQLIRIGVV